MITILDGNAFYLRITGKTKVGEYEATLDLEAIDSLIVNFVRRVRESQAVTHDQGKVLAYNDGKLAKGVYGVEMVGYYNGQPWRFYAPEVFEIADGGETEADNVIGSVNVYDVTFYMKLGGDGVTPGYVDAAVTMHNTSEEAHTDMREAITGIRTQVERRLVGAKVTFSDGHTEDVELGYNDQGEVILLLPKETFGKIDGVKVNGEELPVDDNGKVDINFSATVDGTYSDTPTVTPTIGEDGIQLDFQGIRGNGIASSSEELSNEDGGVNTHKFIDNEGNEHIFHTKNGKQGRPGADRQPVEGSILIAHGPGKSEVQVMSQKAVTDELDAIGSDIYDYAEDGETDTDLSDLIEVTDTSKMVNAPGGTLSNSTGQDASGYIDIGDYDAITYPRNSSAVNSVWGIAFYDENKISRNTSTWWEAAISNAEDATDYVSKRIDVPEGAKYVRLSLRKTGFSTPTLTGHKKTYIKTPKTEKVEEEVSELSTNVGAIDSEVYDYEKSGSEEVADISSLITHHNVGYTVLTAGSLSSGSSINDATDYIDIGDYDAIRYSRNSRSSTVSMGIAFYNSEKTRVGGQVALSNASATDYVITDIDLPEGTKYVRMTIRKATQGWSTPVLIGLSNTYTKSSKIAAIEQKIENVGKGIFPPLIGIPQPYIFTPTEDVGISNFAHVTDLHTAYDALCEQYPKWLHKEDNIGTDATQTYEVRHYTLRYQTPLVSANRNGTGTNYWSDEDMPMRRILLMTGIHAMEQFSTRGTYMAVKAICESEEPWAKFIKANAIIDIIPIINPWGLENQSNYNSNNVNLNRDYKSVTPQVETQNVINLIQSLLPLNLGGLVDMHNTGDGDTYLVSREDYKEYTYYARLAQQLSVIMDQPLQSAFGEGHHMHCWITTTDSDTGQGHWYADEIGILGATFEVKTAANFYGRSSCLTAMQAVNAIIAFLQKMS